MKTISTRKARKLRRLVKFMHPLRYYAINAPQTLWEQYVAQRILDTRLLDPVYMDRQVRAYIRETDV
jgi:hypothetical protein